MTLGTSSVTLKDTATLSGGYYETGTITFTLYLGSTLVDTETVSVTGNGTYTTPTGYTLPTTGTVTGTYQWDASYSGNANNSGVSENNASNEQVVVNPANLSIPTTPGGTMPVGGISISGTKYLDLTGNGFTSDDTPQAGVTIDLYQATSSGGQTLVASTTTGSNGTYSFTVSAPATYYVQESVPSGYIQTGGGPGGSAGDSDYTIVAAAGHSYSGYNFDDYLIPTCTPTNVSYKVTTPSGCSQTVTNLAGNTQQGDTVTVTFTVPSGMNDQLTLVSYIAPGSSFSDSTAYEQVIYQQATGTFAPGTHSLTVSIPNSDYQIDFVCGPAIAQLEPNQNNDAYGPDSANVLYHAEDRFISSDNGGTTAPNPMPAPSPSPTTPAPTSVATTLTDSATLSGGYNPGGSITFYLFAPGVTPNGTDSNNVYSDTVTVSGNGTYTTASGNHPGGYMPTAAGTYEWVAIYSGDPNNSAVTSPFGSEAEVVSTAGPTIATTPGGAVTLGGLVNLTDSAVLAGGYNPGGTITFYLFAPGVTPNGTDSNNVYSDAVTVNGNGTYTTSMGNNAGGYAATKTGTYEWLAVYSGDSNNNGASDTFGNEPETVNASCSVGSGQYATCGFWQGRNGQAVICGFNSGPNCTQLGNWLASTFPNLFGCSNPNISGYLNQCHATSLAGLTNSQIATLCTKLSTSSLSQNTYAQAFACALGIYADTSPFGGNTTAQGCGFNVTWAGNSGATCNVGSNNTPFGVSRNTSLSVYSILQNLNGNFSPSTGNCYGGNQSSTTAACNVLNSINTAGNISNGLTLAAPSGTVAYTPAQIRDAYGINDLTEDGTGQTIAIVDAYDDPDIFQAVDLFDSQFSLTDSGPTLYNQYGAAAAFLTVLNQSGQANSLPSTDPSGVGTDNWELEEELDVEWAHAIAPGAQIVLVEANSAVAVRPDGQRRHSRQSARSVRGQHELGLRRRPVRLRRRRGELRQRFQRPGRNLPGQHGRLRGVRPRVSRVLTQRSRGRRYEPEPQRRQLVQQRDGVGLLLGFVGDVDRLWRRHQPVRDRAVLSGGCPIHRQPDHARRLDGRRSGHRRVDCRPVQPLRRQPVRGRGRHQLVDPGLRGPGRPGRPGTRRRGRGHAEQHQRDRDPASPLQLAAGRLQQHHHRQQRLHSQRRLQSGDRARHAGGQSPRAGPDRLPGRGHGLRWPDGRHRCRTPRSPAPGTVATAGPTTCSTSSAPSPWEATSSVRLRPPWPACCPAGRRQSSPATRRPSLR